MKRILYILICIGLSVQSFALGAGDTDNSGESTTDKVRVASLSGPSGLGMSLLYANPPVLDGHPVSLEVLPSVDVMYPKLLNGDVDIGILPPNVAAKLYNKKPSSVVAGAVVGNGMLSVVSRNPNASSLRDLQGMTIYLTGQGSTPEYVLRTLIARQGLTGIELDFSLPAPELAAAVAAGTVEYALLPEPYATVAVIKGNDGKRPVRRAVKIAEEWGRAALGSDFPMTVCVIRGEFARRNPLAVRAFLLAYRESIEWTIANPALAAKESPGAGVGLEPGLAERAIPSCALTYIPITEARGAIEGLLSVFLVHSPEAVGDKLPDEGFYFR